MKLFNRYDTSIEDVENEVATMRRTSGNYTVRVLDVIAVSDIDASNVCTQSFLNKALVMELALTSVQQEMARLFGQLPLPLVRRCAGHMFAGFSQLHSMGILHRDVKPDSILLRVNDAGATQAVLADFGSCLALRPAVPRPLTRKVCTSWYRPPELFGPAATRTYGSEVDIWSVGCVLGEMLLGQPLFKFDSED